MDQTAHFKRYCGDNVCLQAVCVVCFDTIVGLLRLKSMQNRCFGCKTHPRFSWIPNTIGPRLFRANPSNTATIWGCGIVLQRTHVCFGYLCTICIARACNVAVLPHYEPRALCNGGRVSACCIQSHSNGIHGPKRVFCHTRVHRLSNHLAHPVCAGVFAVYLHAVLRNDRACWLAFDFLHTLPLWCGEKDLDLVCRQLHCVYPQHVRQRAAFFLAVAPNSGHQLVPRHYERDHFCAGLHCGMYAILRIPSPSGSPYSASCLVCDSGGVSETTCVLDSLSWLSLKSTNMVKSHQIASTCCAHSHAMLCTCEFSCVYFLKPYTSPTSKLHIRSSNQLYNF